MAEDYRSDSVCWAWMSFCSSHALLPKRECVTIFFTSIFSWSKPIQASDEQTKVFSNFGEIFGSTIPTPLSKNVRLSELHFFQIIYFPPSWMCSPIKKFHLIVSLNWQCHEIFCFFFMNRTHMGPWLIG